MESFDTDGRFMIGKRKGKSGLKASGALHKYANVELIGKEKDAFALAMKDKYSTQKTSVDRYGSPLAPTSRRQQ